MKKKLVLKQEVKDTLQNELIALIGIIFGLIFCYVLCLCY